MADRPWASFRSAVAGASSRRLGGPGSRQPSFVRVGRSANHVCQKVPIYIGVSRRPDLLATDVGATEFDAPRVTGISN